jgi:Tetratricopeptide repeat
MGLQPEEKSNNRSSFLRVMLEKRRQKKRAPSFDGTLESSTSSMDRSHRNVASVLPQESLPLASVHGPIIVVEEEGTDESLLNDANVKRDIAMTNRVAALHAQQQLLGENHPDVLFSLQNLAALHYRRGEYAQAQRIMEDNQLRRERAQNEHMSSNVPTEIFIQL